MALDKTKIKSKTTLDKLGEKNQVLIKWILSHSGYVGHENEDTLAKKEPIPLMRPCSRAVDSQDYLGRDNKREDEK